MKNILLLTIVVLLSYTSFSQQNIELKRYPAPQAKQGVVANKKYFIVFSNDSIVKYDKKTGKEVSSFYSNKLIHLNSGILRGNKLYCAHSNYPALPMWSSMEVWNIKTMKHIATHSFGIEYGSCTWIEKFKGSYYVMFAHYGTPGKMEPGKDVSWSQLVKFNKHWQKQEAWVLPQELIKKIEPFSLSGGVITKEGKILCSPHHNKELYLLEFPAQGAELVLSKTIATSINGQAIAWDTFEKDVLWGISRDTREVIKTKMVWE